LPLKASHFRSFSSKVKNMAKCGKSEKCGKNVARSSKMWQMPRKCGKMVTLIRSHPASILASI
jgi:hypothetical protein